VAQNRSKNLVAELDRIQPQAPLWKQRQQAQGAPTTNRNINDIYWRKADGWITVGPNAQLGVDGRPLTAQSETKKRYGWEPLIQYSFTDRVSDKTGQRDTIELTADRLGTPDKFYWFFVNGGAPLFPIDQIVAYHWHIKPPFGLPKTVFPQLDEYDVPEPHYCPACAPGSPIKNSPEEVVKHLMVQHQMNLQQVRELQTATGSFRDQPIGAAGLAIRRKAQGIEKQAVAAGVVPTATPSTDLPKPRLIICDQCGDRFDDGLAKARHMKKEHPKPSGEIVSAGEEG
jgi:hypothetical protein